MPLQYTDIRTLLMFVCVFITTYFLSNHAEKHPQRSATARILIIMILTFMCGLRGSSVGRDTQGYYSDIREFQLGNDNALQYYEMGFQYLIKAIFLLTNGIQNVFLTCSFITVFLIVKRFWEMRENISFHCTMVYFVCIVYSSLFSGFRQWVAVAIVFYASRYIEKGKWSRYIIAVVVASTIHLSAVLAITSLGMFYIFSYQFKRRMIKYIVSLLTILGIVATLIGGNYLISLTRYSVQNYMQTSDLGFMIVARVALLLLFMINQGKLLRGAVTRTPASSKLLCNLDTMRFYIQQYFLYTSGCLLGGLFGSSIGRLSWIYIPFECVLFTSKSIDKRHWTYFIIRVLTVLVAAYSFYCLAIRGTQWLTPYKFCWE